VGGGGGRMLRRRCVRWSVELGVSISVTGNCRTIALNMTSTVTPSLVKLEGAVTAGGGKAPL
jgi:hypothetical protein